MKEGRKKRGKKKGKRGRVSLAHFISLESTYPLALNSVTAIVGVLGAGIIPMLLLLDDVCEPPPPWDELTEEMDGVRDRDRPKAKLPPSTPAEGARAR